ncbi:MAG: bifunctional phosphoglucose/phosphomannose isomerase, partial [Candidatus Bipolaricaulia bacterium]
VVGLSYSGDTEETLSSLGMALGQGARVLCISSGGELERLAAREALPFVKVPAGLQPRAALGYLLLPILKVLSRIGLLEQELDHLPEALRRAAAGWGPEVPVEANRAKRLAGWLYRKIPVIYGVEGTTAAVALRWKTQINENGKQPAFWNSVPELCHNEIVALERADLLPHMRVVLLRSPLDHQQNQRRIEIMQELLEERGIDHEEVSVEADGKLLQLLSLVYLGDLVSVYLALQGGVDPTPVKLIVDFKERLRQFP